MEEAGIVRVSSASTQDDKPTLSRRSFVELAVGAITMLPAVSGGFALTLSPETAYADDPVSPTTKIVIAKPNEAGFAVADVADGKRVPVSGAKITITSNESKKSVSGTTGSDGLFVADLSKIAKPVKDANGVDTYSVQASLALEKDGYRSFETGWMSLKGGAGYDLPTRKVGDELAYPKRVTLSDWDVLYTNNEFAVTPANDETHEITIVFCSKVEGEVSANLIAIKKNTIMGSGKAKASDKKGDYYQAKVSMKGAFLLKNHYDALHPNDQYRIDYTVDGKKYSVPIRLKVTDAPSALTAPFAKKMSFAPFGDAAMKLSLRFPSWVPLVAGKELQLWKPDLPIDVCFDPYGYFRASLRTSEWGYKSKNGKVDGNAWKTLPRESFSEQYAKAKNEMASYAMKTAAFMVNGSRSTFDAFEHTRSLKVAFSAEAAIAGRWSSDSNAIRAKAEARGILNIAFSIAKQFFAGPVPIVLQFDLNTHASIGVGCGIIMPYYAEKENSWSAWEYDYSSTGINFTLRIAPALSAGVGAKGVASISLQGLLAFTVFVGVGPLPKGGKEKNPHAIVGLTAKVNVVIQLMFFTIPVNLWTYELPKLYDNWDPGKLYAQGDPAAALSTQAESDWLADVQEMTLDSDLAEMEGSGIEIEASEMTTQSADSDAMPLRYEVNTEELVTDDGLAYGITTFDAAQDQKVISTSGDGKGSLVAGISPDLAVQSEDISVQDAATDAVFAAYKKCGSHDYSTEVINNVENFTELGSSSGIVPGKRLCIAKNVLSDPRVKVVSVFGKAVMFRIAAVKVNGQIRTRIVGQRLQTTKRAAGPICVFDFDPGIRKDPTKGYEKDNMIDRNNLWDYDFDVTVLTQWQNSYQSIQFFVISGTREKGATLGQVASDVVFQHARFDVDEASYNRDRWQIRRNAHGAMASNYRFKFADKGTWYHNFSCPQIQYAEDNYENKKNPRKSGTVTPHDEMLFTFLVRSAQSPDKIMSNKADDGVRVSIGFCSADTIASEHDYSKMLMFDLSELTSKLNDPTIYELSCSKRFRRDYQSGWNIVSLRGAKNAYHYSLLTTVFASEGKDDSFKNLRTRVLEAKLWKKCSADGALDDKEDKDLLKLIDWPAHGEMFLASVDNKLQSASFSNGVLKPTYNVIGSDNFAISSFGLDSSGTVLYYPTVCEGSPGYKYDTPNGVSNIKSTPMPEVKQHRIMACRLRNGKFSDPFVFAEVDYDMDNLAIVNVGSDFIGFVSTDVLDANKGTANMYYTALPFVKCANIIGCEAITTFAFPGSDAMFDLTVRNDGNTYITGFTAHIMEKGGKPQGSKKVVFSKETLQESNYNPSENGKLKDVEDDYALAPGKTSVYRIALTIPKGWSGTKNVCVKATDVVIAPVSVSSGKTVKSASNLSAQADLDVIDPTNPSDPFDPSTTADYWIDGDSAETYGYNDSGAYEYVVGTNESDYDNEDGGEPYGIISMEGEEVFFDDDDYDDNDDDGDEGDDPAEPSEDEDDYDLSLDDAPISEPDKDSDEEDDSGDNPGDNSRDNSSGNSGSNGASSSKSSKGSSSSSPKTGDLSGPLTGLLGAAALAGAAMTAYSARRVANEKNRNGEEE